MSVNTKRRRLSNSYFKLVRRFPLTHIKNETQFVRAQQMIDRLLEQTSDSGVQQYLDVLTDLVESYENDHEPMPDASEADVLSELMRSNRMTQTQLAKKTGVSQSTISAVLSGARSLTKEQIIVLARHFRVSPAAFLPN